jgi:hypothetical protein
MEKRQVHQSPKLAYPTYRLRDALSLSTSGFVLASREG